MKKLIFIFMMISFINFSEEFLLSEDFDNNDDKWYEVKNKDVEIKVENGYYNTEHKKEDSSWLVWKDFEYDTKNIFGAEANIKYEKGNNSEGYGIYIEVDNDVRIVQEVTNDGYMCFYIEKNDEYNYILDWTKDDSVKPNMTNNFIFLMEREDGEFFLNGINIGEVKIGKESKVTKIGIKVNGKLKINVDSIKIYDKN